MNKIEELSAAEQVSMADDWFAIANEEHFWMNWRFEFLKMLLRNRVYQNSELLEIGCGNGVLKNQLESIGFTVDGCDLNRYALDMARSGKGRLMIYNVYDQNKELINRYDGIFLMDVIEHLEDDVDFLKTSIQHLKKDGYVFINVPANMWLFSKYDTAAGHFRRYNKKMMRTLLENAGLEIVEMKFWGISLIPLALTRKLFLSVQKEAIISKGFKPPSTFIHQILKSIKSIESSLLKSQFTGTSLLAVGKKIS